jgi:hypothetical protein
VPAAGAGTRSPHVGCRQRAVDLPRTASQSYTRYCRHSISGFPVPAAGAGTRSPHVGCRQRAVDRSRPTTNGQSVDTRYCRHPIPGFPVPAAGAGTRSPHVGCRQRAVDRYHERPVSHTLDTAGILSLVFRCRQPVPALDPHMSGAGSR